MGKWSKNSQASSLLLIPASDYILLIFDFGMTINRQRLEFFLRALVIEPLTTYSGF